MALLATLPEGDTRPVFDATHLPGGAWHTYRNRQVVEAVFVKGAFLVRRPSDGMLIEAADRWVLLDQATGQPSLLAQDAFAQTYEVAG
jgi:hypothetical protein